MLSLVSLQGRYPVQAQDGSDRSLVTSCSDFHFAMADEAEIPLPPDILQNSVLSFVDLHSLVRFSGCSRKCRKVVFAMMHQLNDGERCSFVMANGRVSSMIIN